MVAPPPPGGVAPFDSSDWWTDMGKALGAVAAAEVFDKTWFIMILVSLRLNKWAAFTGGYVALAAHTGIAAAIGYGASQIPGLKQYTLDFVTAGVLLLFAMLYACEAYETPAGTDLMAEGREEAAADLDKDKEGDGKGEASQREACLPCSECCARSPPLKTVRKLLAGLCGAARRSGRLGSDESDPLKGNDAASEGVQLLSGLVRCFCAVFIAEFGDRTQIVMISLHSSHPVAPIIVGSLLAFLLLSGSAVLLSAFLATRKLDAKAVRVLVALSFAIFAGVAFQEGLQGVRSGRDAFSSSVPENH